MRISDWSSDVCSSDLREPFLQPVPPYPGTDPLELPRHALEIIDRRSHPLPPFEALAGVLLDPLDPRGRLLRDPIGPRLPPPIEQDALKPAGIGRGRGVEHSGGGKGRDRRGRPLRYPPRKPFEPDCGCSRPSGPFGGSPTRG